MRGGYPQFVLRNLGLPESPQTLRAENSWRTEKSRNLGYRFRAKLRSLSSECDFGLSDCPNFSLVKSMGTDSYAGVIRNHINTDFINYT